MLTVFLRSFHSVTGIGEPTLSVLTTLSELEHLEVPPHSNSAMLLPADYAALTASPQLTHLGLANAVTLQHAVDVFPDGLRLPKLASLSVCIDWLQDADTVQRVVDCCPGLEELQIESHGGGEIAGVHPMDWAARLGCLAGLSALTRLSMMVLDFPMTTEVYRAIGTLTGLRELSWDCMEPTYLGPAVQLTSCRQLTKLEICVMTSAQEDNEFGIITTNKVWSMFAIEPDFGWSQLQQAVLPPGAGVASFYGCRMVPAMLRLCNMPAGGWMWRVSL